MGSGVVLLQFCCHLLVEIGNSFFAIGLFYFLKGWERGRTLEMPEFYRHKLFKGTQNVHKGLK